MSARDIVLSGGGSSAPVYVDDVFSTYLYTGNGSTQTITNGIDLAGKGGMVWAKSRSSVAQHVLADTVRGTGQVLQTSTTDGNIATALNITSFNADGYGLSSYSGSNGSGITYASWTFRKQPKFFDIVTYTGNATNPRTIPHSLSSVPGMIIIKRTDAIGDWWVYHNGITVNQYLILNTTAAVATSASIWGAGPTSTGFTVNAGAINATGATYVAYIYAHNAGGFGNSGGENAISCGSFTTDAFGNATVNLGYEPQYLMTKATSFADGWQIKDIMRRLPDGTEAAATLYPNTSGAESLPVAYPHKISATRFSVVYEASKTYIYMAIRRPNKPPTSGTEVFYAGTGNGSATVPAYVTNFPVDAGITVLTRTGVSYKGFTARLLGNQIAYTDLTAAYGGENDVAYDSSKGFMKGTWGGAGAYTDTFSWAFRRASGFFDVVCYTGTGVATTVNHNLGVVPELIIVKARNRSGVYVTGWSVWSTSVVSTYGSSYLLSMNETSPAQANSAIFTTTQPTSTVFSVGTNDSSNASANGNLYVAYLFATLAGISKVGSYTGNGTSQTIACGFTTGARFIMIKRTDSTGDWYIWDSVRGIVSANDPHLSLNTTVAEVTTDDSVDPDNSGFIVNQVAATNINVTSATYIFLAIA
jgi:hypothetical protein